MQTRPRSQPESSAATMGRRHVLMAPAAWVLAAAASRYATAAEATSAKPIERTIPASGESMPVVGLGSWITFNVGNDRQGLQASTQVVREFFAAGGRLIDSSPMYGSSQPTIGQALTANGRPAPLFSAEKVWTGDAAGGAAQIEQSRVHWGVQRFDLMQVHNLLAWQQHLPRLFEMKRAGRLRHVGITTSHGRRHPELERLMQTQPIDFVQLTYNMVDRDVEQRLLPLARERGIAVIVNRPFLQGDLIDRLARLQLPSWAAEIDCTHWAQIALKFIIAHPAVTCVIPATRQPRHLQQNMAAAHGRLPDAALRQRIASVVARL